MMHSFILKHGFSSLFCSLFPPYFADIFPFFLCLPEWVLYFK